MSYEEVIRHVVATHSSVLDAAAHATTAFMRTLPSCPGPTHDLAGYNHGAIENWLVRDIAAVTGNGGHAVAEGVVASYVGRHLLNEARECGPDGRVQINPSRVMGDASRVKAMGLDMHWLALTLKKVQTLTGYGTRCPPMRCIVMVADMFSRRA